MENKRYDEDCMLDCCAEEIGSSPDYSIAENSDTVYTTMLCGERRPLPEPAELKCEKSVISISLTVHEERGEWIDWWIDADNPGICLPSDEREIARYLRKFEIILVGDKWFAGKDADKAIAECYRQYRKITLLNDKDHLIAEIYDQSLLMNPTEDLGRYRWMSQTCGNVERSLADVLEDAEPGETYKHNYKGW